MKVKVLPVGSMSVNCYIVYDEELKEGMIIDPGDDGYKIISEVKNLGVNVLYIVFTHVHFDHILAYHDVKNEFKGAKLLLSSKEVPALYDKNLSLLNYVSVDFKEIKEYEEVKHGDKIEFKNMSFTVFETPGHTKGSMCLYGENTLFSGDTLFCGSVGRGDFMGGSITEEIKSIKSFLLPLPENTVVYPGHGDKTTIGFEIKNNGFLI